MQTIIISSLNTTSPHHTKKNSHHLYTSLWGQPFEEGAFDICRSSVVKHRNSSLIFINLICALDNSGVQTVLVTILHLVTLSEFHVINLDKVSWNSIGPTVMPAIFKLLHVPMVDFFCWLSRIALTVDDHPVLLVSVPRFSSSGTAVLVNLQSLQCQPLTFHSDWEDTAIEQSPPR